MSKNQNKLHILKKDGCMSLCGNSTRNITDYEHYIQAPKQFRCKACEQAYFRQRQQGDTLKTLKSYLKTLIPTSASKKLRILPFDKIDNIVNKITETDMQTLSPQTDYIRNYNPDLDITRKTNRVLTVPLSEPYEPIEQLYLAKALTTVASYVPAKLSFGYADFDGTLTASAYLHIHTKTMEHAELIENALYEEYIFALCRDRQNRHIDSIAEVEPVTIYLRTEPLSERTFAKPFTATRPSTVPASDAD